MRRNTSLGLELFNKNYVRDNFYFLSETKWYDIDEEGNINKPLMNRAAIYIYMCSSISHNKPRYYVGSTIKLKTRVSSHKYYPTNWSKYKDNRIGCPVFYKSVSKYGWLRFKFGILKYIALPNQIEIELRKKITLEKEQYYLDNINPSLCKKRILS